MEADTYEFDLTYDPYLVEMARVPAFVEMVSAFIHREICVHPYGCIMDIHKLLIVPDWAVNDYLITINGTEKTFVQKPSLAKISSWLIEAFDHANILESDIKARAFRKKTSGKIEFDLSLNFSVKAFEKAIDIAKAQMQRNIFHPASHRNIPL